MHPARTSPSNLTNPTLLLPRSATTIPQSPAAPTSTTITQGQYPLIEPVFDEVCEMSGVTLTRYMMEVSRANPHLKEIESLMNSIQTACKVRGVGGWRVGVVAASFFTLCSCCFCLGFNQSDRLWFPFDIPMRTQKPANAHSLHHSPPNPPSLKTDYLQPGQPRVHHQNDRLPRRRLLHQRPRRAAEEA